MPWKPQTARGHATYAAVFALLMTTSLVLFGQTDSARAITWWHVPIYFVAEFVAIFAFLRLRRPAKGPSRSEERP